MEADGPGREELLTRKPKADGEAAAPKKRARRRRPKKESANGMAGDNPTMAGEHGE